MASVPRTNRSGCYTCWPPRDAVASMVVAGVLSCPPPDRSRGRQRPRWSAAGSSVARATHARRQERSTIRPRRMTLTFGGIARRGTSVTRMRCVLRLQVANQYPWSHLSPRPPPRDPAWRVFPPRGCPPSGTHPAPFSGRALPWRGLGGRAIPAPRPHRGSPEQKPSYGVSFAYVLADTYDKRQRALQVRARTACIASPATGLRLLTGSATAQDKEVAESKRIARANAATVDTLVWQSLVRGPCGTRQRDAASPSRSRRPRSLSPATQSRSRCAQLPVQRG